jgi:hypothetical protein
LNGERKLKVLITPDLHAPFHHVKAVEWLYSQIEKYPPDVIVQIGDALDRFCFSRFARTHDIMTPKEEIDEGRAFMVNFWAHIHKLVPKALKYQLLGNHSDRLLRQTMERFPEVYSIVKAADHEFFKFKNVITIMDSRAMLEIEDVIYVHGWSSKIGDHAKHFGKSVCRGHSHRLEVQFMNLAGNNIFEMACGFLADENQTPLQYGQSKVTNWTLGHGYVSKAGPVPFAYPKGRK